MTKTEQLECLVRELEAYRGTYGLEDLSSCLYSAVKILIRGNRLEAVGKRLLTACDAAYAERAD